MLTHFSVCTGGGGIDIAAEQAGFETVAQCEIEAYCNLVLEMRFPGLPYWEDVHHVTAKKFSRKTGIAPGELTLLSAGIPCQPHSVAGARKGSSDERDLKDEAVRIIGELRPRWVLVENVPGLLSSDDGRYFGDFLRQLAALGYDVGWCSFRAADIGAKHPRERIFIVAHAKCQRPIHGEYAARCGQELFESGGGIMANSRGRGLCGTGICPEQQRGAETISASQVMADTQRNVAGRLSFGAGEAQPGFELGGSALENPERGRLQEPGNTRIPGRPAETVTDGSCGTLEYTDSERGRGRHDKRENAENVGELSGGSQFGKRQPEPRLGGTPYGLADWLDSVGWIADKGEAKEGTAYAWEPPRTAVGVENRGKRIKMVGNGVVPQAPYLLLEAIADIEGQ
jgi:DNA (cytosine-5)-methyltransferase 1